MHASRAWLPAIVILAALGALLAASRARDDRGTLELRWRFVPDAASEVERIEARPAWAGANSGADRDLGWQRIALREKTVDLVGGPDAQAQTVAVGGIQQGQYVRAFVAAPDIWALEPTGQRRKLTSHVEPIVIPFRVRPQQKVTVEIVLTVLPAAEHSRGAPEVFVRDASLVTSQFDPHEGD